MILYGCIGGRIGIGHENPHPERCTGIGRDLRHPRTRPLLVRRVSLSGDIFDADPGQIRGGQRRLVDRESHRPRPRRGNDVRVQAARMSQWCDAWAEPTATRRHGDRPMPGQAWQTISAGCSRRMRATTRVMATVPMVRPQVTAAAVRAGFSARTEVIAGWLDPDQPLLGFLHRVTVCEGLVLDGTARQFAAFVPMHGL